MRSKGWERAGATPLLRGERRRAPRGVHGEPERAQVVSLILGTFNEMLGTRLTVAEARRMFGLREVTCKVVLDHLVTQNRLRRTNDGKYTMA
jgi:hypothetical protein